jgi:HAD superfamily hydrolase (TIGR01509 family)
MKKYILFDNDGVLVETEPWYFTANVEILKTMGIDLTEDRYRDIMINGQSAFLLAEEAGFDRDTVEEARAKRNELYQHYIRTENIEIDGVQEVLHALAKKYRMAIVTSAIRADFELIHGSRPLLQYMEFALCSGEYGRSKPHPDPYLKGLDLLGGAKHEAVVVEDSERGLRSAVNAGIDCVVVHNHFTSSHDFSSASHKIQTLQELEKLLS